jgi:hypothetical protein
MDRREHHRVQLRIPARLRWTMLRPEDRSQLDAERLSRCGLLVACKEDHAPGLPLWVTFPYDSSLPYDQPEILARVVHSMGEDRMSGSTNGDEKIGSANAGIGT